MFDNKPLLVLMLMLYKQIEKPRQCVKRVSDKEILINSITRVTGTFPVARITWY